jgi:hypothetical protein
MSYEKDRKNFANAIITAMFAAEKTGTRYFVLFPYVANAGYDKDDVFLVVPVIQEGATEGTEINEVAFTVYPDGTIKWGIQ